MKQGEDRQAGGGRLSSQKRSSMRRMLAKEKLLDQDQHARDLRVKIQSKASTGMTTRSMRRAQLALATNAPAQIAVSTCLARCVKAY